MKTIQILALIALIQVGAHAEGGAMAGGGGDPSELRVNEIRQDIRSWIMEGGSNQLHLPSGLSVKNYNASMLRITRAKRVGITFVKKDSLTDRELMVTVHRKPKTCRSFYSRRNGRPNIVCNLFRFNSASPADQYKLIHHEYAGLMSLEINEGANSDYFISDQLSEFLEVKSVLKLGLSRVPSEPVKFIVSTTFDAKFSQLQKESKRLTYLLSQGSSFETVFKLSQELEQMAQSTQFFFYPSPDYAAIVQKLEILNQKSSELVSSLDALLTSRELKERARSLESTTQELISLLSSGDHS